MDSALTSVGLPLALGLVMFGLGLSLTVADFTRIARAPKAVAIALVCQIVLLPLVAFGLVRLFDLPWQLGVGMMLLAASPGGTTASLFSHLFRGDVALNISLTAINTVIAVVTLPLITSLAINYYGEEGDVAMPFSEVLKVFVIILVPVGIGMLVNARAHGWAARMDKTVRIGSAIVLAILVLGILVAERANVTKYLGQVGLITAIFCAISLLAGYYVPRLLGVGGPQAIASSMEIGVHNSTLAIVIATSVLKNTEISVPAAVYSLIMFLFAALWGSWVSKRVSAEPERV
ncbi:MAG: bile acid:sodium symporter family protein [Nocardioides sp.]|jgi:BASS family bile acid:Na+ symporter